MCADSELDIIDVGTRPDLRAPMVLAALANRKHVYASANFAPDLKTARIMRDAAREAGTVCTLDSVFPWQPAHQEVKRLLKTGETGKPIAVNVRLHISHFATADAGGEGWKWFGTRKHGASAMRNLGTHSLHLLTWLLGPVESVTALATIAKTEWRFQDGSIVKPEVEDTAQLMLRFASGAMGALCLSWSSPAKTGWYMELTCERATLVTLDEAGFPSGNRVRLFRGEAASPLSEVAPIPQASSIRFESPPPIPQVHDIAQAVAQMIQAIRYDEKAHPDFEDAFHVEAVLDAARQAIKVQGWVQVVKT